nr:hypothetical protein BaRGS_026934 [Batillaria attramentaria]
MVRYMNELNNLESRKGRRPLDLTNIIYWFKNARAAQRRASKALDDSFENEENVDVNGGHPAVAASPSEPPPVPYLPNKNAVYVIPFPYHSPHSAHPHHMLSDSMSEAYDEPCDLSIKKLRDTPTFSHMESRATPNGRSRSEGLSQNGESNKPTISNSRKRSPVRGSYSVKTISREDGSGHKSPAACNGFPENLGSGKSIPSVVKDMVVNGHDNGHKFLQSHYAEVKDSDSGEPGPLLTGMKEEVASDDDDNSVHSDESDGGGRLKINEDEDEIDYGAPHMRNGLGIGVGGGGMVVSAAESSAASMAALSLAQMSQPLHIPQLAPHLAMYYPMAPRYYPPPPSHHAQSSAAATAAMVAALSNSAHLSSKASSSANSITTNNVTASGHPSTSNRPVPIQPAPHPPLSTPHGHPHGRSEPRKRRTRVFIDPLTEIPKLEKWFLEDTHPSAYMIDKYTEALNAAEYRQKFPKLEPKNIQLWFKNHRAKVKRMRMGLEMEDSYCDSPPPHGARSSPLPDSGSREEMSSSSPERASSSSKNDDESPGGSGGDNGNEEELMDEDAQ